MKAIVLALATLSLLAIAPAPAQAHVVVCEWGDFVCLAECEASHSGPGDHLCGMKTPPRTSSGNPVETHSCHPPEYGIGVSVLGRPVLRCFIVI